MLCLNCGYENPDGSSCCINCGESLLSDRKDVSQPKGEAAECEWYIRCPVCGQEHAVAGPDSRISVCSGCSDILDRLLIASELPRKRASDTAEENTQASEEGKNSSAVYRLRHLNTGETFPIKDGSIFGREGDIQVGSPYLSSKLLEFRQEQGELYVKLLAVTNKSFLGEKEMVPGKTYKLWDKAVLQSADVFIIIEELT